MLLRFDRWLDTFKHLLDEINSPARTIQLVAENLLRWAGRSAKAAVHAGAQDCVGLNAFGRVFDEVG